MDDSLAFLLPAVGLLSMYFTLTYYFTPRNYSLIRKLKDLR